MQLAEDRPDGQYFIRSLTRDAIRIVDTRYSASLIVSPEHGVSDWPVTAVDGLEIADFEPVLARQPDVVLLATGRTLRFPARDIQIELLRNNVGLEVMTLESAARTFNVLASEERRVVAAMIWEPGTDPA